MKYEIYIKGCWDGKSNSASTALAIVCDGKAINKKSAKFDNEIPTKNGQPIAILKNRGQFQMELYAIVWALTLLEPSDDDIVIYSNVQAVVGWINAGFGRESDIPEDYRKFFNACRTMSKGRRITGEWMPKSTDNEWNKLVNDVAFELIRMKGSPITKIF